MKLLILNIIIFFIVIIIGTFFAVTLTANGQDEFMWCDDCIMKVQMEYKDGLFKNINFIYEW